MRKYFGVHLCCQRSQLRAGGRERGRRGTPTRLPRWGPRPIGRGAVTPDQCFSASTPPGPRRAVCARWGGSMGLFAAGTRRAVATQVNSGVKSPYSARPLFVDRTALHHELDASERADVFGRVAVERHEVGIQSRLYLTDLI